MSYYAAVDLDLLDEAQALKATTANNFFKAASASALWGVRLGSLSGLQFPLYGGNMNIAGVPTAITSQTVTLTANAINYIYATSAGVVTKTTSIPSGWPGPLAAGAIALYKLDVGASSVDTESADTLCYVNGMGQQGDAGVTGADGPAGTDLAATRKRLWMTVGGGSTDRKSVV